MSNRIIIGRNRKLMFETGDTCTNVRGAVLKKKRRCKTTWRSKGWEADATRTGTMLQHAAR